MSMEDENQRRAEQARTRHPSSQSLRNNEGCLICSNEDILGMAGWGPRAQFYERETEFVWRVNPNLACRVGEPFRQKEVLSEVNQLINTAREWLLEKFPSLDEWNSNNCELVELYELLQTKQCEIIKVEPGSSIQLERSRCTGFASKSRVLGEVTEQVVAQQGWGYGVTETVIAKFEGFGAVYTEWAEHNNGIVWHSKLVVAE